MDYKVIWDDEAIGELAAIVRRIAKNNPDAARKTGELLLQKAGLLSSFPQFGKVFKKLHREDVREISVPPYRIIYHVKAAQNCVQILTVWHGARREPDIQSLS